jgi:hypothetical protein
MNEIIPIQNTNNIRMADFVRVTTASATYRFATTPNVLTIPAVDALPFDALGSLVKVGDVQRDIKSTANETSITLVGLDTALLGWVLGHDIKGSLIEMWHGFFDENNELITTGGTGGLYKFFTGYHVLKDCLRTQPCHGLPPPPTPRGCSRACCPCCPGLSTGQGQGL